MTLTPDSIARGKYVYALSRCDECHSARDWTRFGGPVIESERGAGCAASANITPELETGIGAWTDGEKIRAVREGIGRSGFPLSSAMPASRLRAMTDADVRAIVAYLNTLKPVRHKVSPSRTAPLSWTLIVLRCAMGPAGRAPVPDPNDAVRYGEYLVGLAGCRDCHTPTLRGKPATEMLFAGGAQFDVCGATAVSANITPEGHTGIGRWSARDFSDHFSRYHDYRADGLPRVGPESCTTMPWLLFGDLKAQDLNAIYSFLRAQTPVYHLVDSHPLHGISHPR